MGVIVMRWKRRVRRRVRITSGPLCVPKKKTGGVWGFVEGMMVSVGGGGCVSWFVVWGTTAVS